MATCGASLSATSYGGALAVTVASSSIASVEGYLAEEILLGQSPSLEGIIVTAVSGAECAMAGAVITEVVPKVASGISKAVSDGNKVSNVDVSQKTYQTYTKINPTTMEVYSGRTSGTGTQQRMLQSEI